MIKVIFMLAISIREIIEFLRNKFKNSPLSINKVIIFGSVARRDFRPYSDIDMAVVYERDFGNVKKFTEAIANETYLKFFVPITVIYITKEDFDADKTSLIKTIKREGVVIWSKD